MITSAGLPLHRREDWNEMTAPLESTSRPWWKRAWAWGLIAAILLAVVPPLVDADIKLQVSIVVVLVGWVLTAAVEQYISLDATQERLGTQLNHSTERLGEVRHQFGALVDAMEKLMPVANANERCQAFVTQVAANWSTIEDRNHMFFREILDAYHHEVAQFLVDLADGEAKIDSDKFYSFHSLPLDRIRELCMVHVDDLGYWSSRGGHKYLARQAEQIAAGQLKVERIFVLDNPLTDSDREVIAAHVQAGIKVKLAVRGDVPREARQHIIDQGVVTDANGEKMLVRSVRDAHDGQLQAHEWLSYRQDQVADAEHSFTTLWEYYSDEVEDDVHSLSTSRSSIDT
jgi:hypothetical protein